MQKNCNTVNFKEMEHERYIQFPLFMMQRLCIDKETTIKQVSGCEKIINKLKLNRR